MITHKVSLGRISRMVDILKETGLGAMHSVSPDAERALQI